MNDFVGYKEKYWEYEMAENPERTKKHNIVNNRMSDPEPFRPGREVPIPYLKDLPKQEGVNINLQASSVRGAHW